VITRKIGKVQRLFLRACLEHGGYGRGYGWVWGGNAHSEKLAAALVRRELLEPVQTPWGVRYKITPAGVEMLERGPR